MSRRHTQLGFDFFDAAPAASDSSSPVVTIGTVPTAFVPMAAAAPLPADLQAHLDDVERDILVRALERYRYNRTAAGASMGLSLRQMRYRMARLGVTAGDSLADPL